MKVMIREKICVERTPQVNKWCYDELVLENPQYHKLERMGKWTGGTPRTIVLYETVGDWILLPFGMLQKFHEAFGDVAEYKSRIKPFSASHAHSNIKLYPYQDHAVQAILKMKNGIVVMPCGAGKTQTALEAIARIGGRTLWLTHTQDLLTQSKNRSLSVLDIPKSDYGTITSGKVDIGKVITFATVQTLSKIDISRYRDVWDVIVVDECQHCCGSPTRVTQFYKVLSSLSARYKIGLTATPKRADGLEKAMFALLGGVIHEVDRNEIVDTTCPIKIVSCETQYEPDYDEVLDGDGVINYAKLVDDLTEDEDRYITVFEVIKDIKTSALVLANRVKYIEQLNKDFNKYVGKSVCLSTLGSSKQAKEYRKQVLKDLDSGKIDCVFATYQLAKEGLDVPSLRYVVFSTPEKDETTVIQSVGRVGRKADGKEYGTVIDFVDDFGMYRGWHRKRMGYYKKLDCEVI